MLVYNLNFKQLASPVIPSKMNKSTDPFRFLKRMKSRTPSKHSLQSSKTEVNDSEPSVMIESKLEETILLKQNCYDVNKYYSSNCQKYLQEIGYKKRLSSPQQKTKENQKQLSQLQKVKTNESEVNSSLKPSSQSLEIVSQKKDVFMMIPPEGRELTFKKIDFSDKSQNVGFKENRRNLEIEIDQFDQNEQKSPNSDDIQVILRPCEVCGRKFKEESYAKHINVCQTVFFKKRKKFSSEKQRSQSKQKKNQQTGK